MRIGIHHSVLLLLLVDNALVLAAIFDTQCKLIDLFSICVVIVFIDGFLFLIALV